MLNRRSEQGQHPRIVMGDGMSRLKTTLLSGLAALGLSAPAAVAANYLPVGPQLNVSLNTVTTGGWQQCYSAPMSTFLGFDAEGSLPNCTGSSIMLAGRVTGSNTLLVLAQAPRADVFYNTGYNTGVTHEANGTAWYNAPMAGWGFAPAGSTVNKDPCDITPGAGRMCVSTSNGNGGYRINDFIRLNSSDGYEKLVFTFVGGGTWTEGGGAVPEPSTWALMIGGFCLAGATLRRRARGALRA